MKVTRVHLLCSLLMALAVLSVMGCDKDTGGGEEACQVDHVLVDGECQHEQETDCAMPDLPPHASALPPKNAHPVDAEVTITDTDAGGSAAGGMGCM